MAYRGYGGMVGVGGLSIIIVMNLVVISLVINATNAGGNIYSDDWVDGAHATFYGQPGDTPDSMGGACGYGEMTKQWYGSATTALSTALFKNGASCGGCYQLRCVDEPNWNFCKPGRPTVTVTATNFCPPGGLGWCNDPHQHFDMDVEAWKTFGVYEGGIVAVQYKRVPCNRKDRVRFTVHKGNENFYLVLISNVGGAGVVTAASYSTDNTHWEPMSRNWGQNWQITKSLRSDLPLSFTVTTEDQDTKLFPNALPKHWQAGLNYEASIQF